MRRDSHSVGCPNLPKSGGISAHGIAYERQVVLQIAIDWMFVGHQSALSQPTLGKVSGDRQYLRLQKSRTCIPASTVRLYLHYKSLDFFSDVFDIVSHFCVFRPLGAGSK